MHQAKWSSSNSVGWTCRHPDVVRQRWIDFVPLPSILPLCFIGWANGWSCWRWWFPPEATGLPSNPSRGSGWRWTSPRSIHWLWRSRRLSTASIPAASAKRCGKGASPSRSRLRSRSRPGWISFSTGKPSSHLFLQRRVTTPCSLPRISPAQILRLLRRPVAPSATFDAGSPRPR